MPVILLVKRIGLGLVMDEKISIRESAKSLKKYGSTNSHQKRPEHFVKHVLSQTDTLQGIALKYGVTVSNFILHTLLINIS